MRFMRSVRIVVCFKIAQYILSAAVNFILANSEVFKSLPTAGETLLKASTIGLLAILLATIINYCYESRQVHNHIKDNNGIVLSR